jgi:hypothetical protein
MYRIKWMSRLLIHHFSDRLTIFKSTADSRREPRIVTRTFEPLQRAITPFDCNTGGSSNDAELVSEQLKDEI